MRAAQPPEPHMPEGAEGDGAASVEDRAAWAAAANDDHQTRAKTTEEIVEEEAKLEQAAKDTVFPCVPHTASFS
eukprot:SAG31_NODE_96_length_25743_cov_56.175948_17_plen_74_part_00